MSLMMSTPPGISAFPSPASLLVWTATLLGPADTPYEDLTFKLRLEFPSNYPYSPPAVTFKTPIYHPNVDFSGRICLDILKEKWSAAMNVQSVLLSLQSLLGEPNKWVCPSLAYIGVLTPGSSSPLNGQAAEFWDNNMEEFKRQVLARHRELEDEEE